MSVYDRLIAYLQNLDLDCNVEELQLNTSLIQSGLLGSLAVFQLATWIEQEVEAPIDLTAFNLTEAWDTIADILRFIEIHRLPSIDLQSTDLQSIDCSTKL